MATSEKQISLFTKAQSTGLPVATPARVTALSAKWKEKIMKGSCGTKCSGQQRKFFQEESLMKMLQEAFLTEYSTGRFATLTESVTPAGNPLLSLQISAE